MALPILGVVAGVAARAAAKKAASRAVGGIAGKGAKKVNPVYRMMDKQTSPLSKAGIPSKAHPDLHFKVSSNVKVIPSSTMKKTNTMFNPSVGARAAREENKKLITKNPKALKVANAKRKKGALPKRGK